MTTEADSQQRIRIEIQPGICSWVRNEEAQKMNWDMPVPIPAINSTFVFPSAHIPNFYVPVLFMK